MTYWKSYLYRLKTCLISGIVMIGFLFSQSLFGQIERYPANVNPIVNAPYSAYISDYIEPGSQRFIGNVLFNDFNETSWTFKLKLTIQSANVSLQTRPGFTPSVPITVTPGQPYQFSGSEWSEYFNFANLNVKGDVNTIINSGRLPEGRYSFCLQVLDYDTGDPLSDEICSQIWIQLMDPPRVISPVCGSVIDPATTTQFPVTWQSFNTVNPNGNNVEYQLTIWELLEVGADPLSAVANGQALQVFQSSPLINTYFSYGPTQPILDIGKTYIYGVQALDQDGKSYYKNFGQSEYCYFHYGYPLGGKIDLLFPKRDAGFKRGQVPKVKWSSPNNMVQGQGVNYELLIKEMSEDEDPEQAILSNETFYFRRTGVIRSPNAQPQNIEELDIEQKYAWQVKAFSSDIEVASSNVSTFFGPSLVEVFYAGNSKVLVDYISNKDLENLSGGGRVLLSDNKSDWREVTFENLVINESNGYYFLESGTIFGAIKPRTYSLKARFEDNGPAKFVYDEFKLDKDGIFVKGQFYWDLPFPVEEGAPTQIVTQEKWLEFNNFTVFGNTNLIATDYELFDPTGFTLGLSETSQVFINQGTYSFSLNGTVGVVDQVKSITDSRAGWAFSEAEQLGIIQTSQTEGFFAMDNSGIEVHPLSSIIDLSDNESPGKHSSDPYWKGAYILEAKYRLPVWFDKDKQLSVSAPLEESVRHDATQQTEMWVSARGLNLKVSLDLTGSDAFFNTFPAEYTSLTLDISNGNVNAESTLQGNIFIPVISEDNPFNFDVQICNQGFRPGTLPNLIGTTFVHNQDGGELALNGAVTRASIVDKERIQMTVDLDWPSIEVFFKGVPNFNAWGNYSVGFFTPEGIVALSEQIETTFKTYPVTIDALSAGRNKDYYGIAISGKVVMGEDVSGDDGPPAFNLYSLAQNELLDVNYEPAKVEIAMDLGSAQDGMAQLESDLAALEEDLNNKIEQESAALESAATDGLLSAAVSIGGQEYAIDELVTEVPADESQNLGDIKEQLIAFLTTLKDFFPDPEKQESINELIARVQDANDEVNSLEDIVDELKRFASDYAAGYVAAQIGDKFLQKVDKITYDVNKSITDQANRLTKTVHDQMEATVGQLVDNVANQAINSFGDRAPKVAAVVLEIAATTKAAIINEVVNSVNQSVNQNVVYPVTSFIAQSIHDRAHRLVEETARKVVMGALSSEQNPGEVMGDVIDGLDEEIRGLAEEIAGQVDMDKILETVRKLGSDAVGNIIPGRISKNIIQGAKDAVAGVVLEEGLDRLEDLANTALGDEIGIAIPVNFGKVISGNPKELLFDPIPVKVRSSILDINGLIHFMKDHPIYGDGFAGSVTGLIKKPNTFEIDLIYLNGRKEGLSFWMVEIGGAATSQQSMDGDQNQGDQSKFKEAGGEMSSNMEEAPKGLKLGPLEMMALRGRLYHKMSADGFGELKPDANTNYGAYLHLVMFGPKHGELMRLEIDASMSTFASGDYVFSFDGNAQFLNTNPQVYQIDEKASIQAVLSLKYNSAEKHFFGYAEAVVETNAVCAHGSLLIDVKPGAWRVAIGSEEKRIRFVMGCVGFGPTGWLDMTQSSIALGLGLEFLFEPPPIKLDLAVAKVSLEIEAGAAAGIKALVEYKPNFKIMEAGVWLELWAGIFLSYETAVKKGSITLAEIYLAADATMRFNPPPTLLYGKVNGQVTVLFLNFSFNKDFEMNM